MGARVAGETVAGYDRRANPGADGPGQPPPASRLQVKLARSAVRVEQLLEGLLGTTPLPGETARPERLMAAMRHAVLGGGKRLRPFLVLAVADLFGRDGEGALRAAGAV